MILRAFATLGLLFAVAAAVGTIFVATRQNLRFDAPYPAIAASADTAVIARGRYIVRALAPCASCHSDPADAAALQRGEEVPLSGGQVWDIPPGQFYSPNLTPDPETGIGAVPDSAIARALRHGVRPDGSALLPFMKLQELADQDLEAVLSYLRSQPPIRHPVPAHRFSLLGKVVKATVFGAPVGAATTPPRSSPRGATVDNGRYLVEAVMKCGDCHTQLDLKNGARVGSPFAGATGLPDPGQLQGTWSAPNLTAAPRTGRLGRMSEDAFVARMRAGRTIAGSPMPWQFYRQVSEPDLRAVYRYLMTVPRFENEVGPAFVDRKKR